MIMPKPLAIEAIGFSELPWTHDEMLSSASCENEERKGSGEACDANKNNNFPTRLAPKHEP